MEKKELPYTQVYVNTGEPIKERDLVEFRLLYEGELLPSGTSKTRAPEKHLIRRAFHPQLRRLWFVHPRLRQLGESIGTSVYGNEISSAFSKEIESVPKLSTDEAIRKAFEYMGKNWARNGYRFVPLVTENLSLRCALDILLLRPGDEKYIFQQGDIDAQVKTLFDALKVPQNFAEAGSSPPQEDETPFFCLLEDDRLISEVRVLSDQLLLLPREREAKANDCFAVITVKINHKSPGTFDNWFL